MKLLTIGRKTHGRLNGDARQETFYDTPSTANAPRIPVPLAHDQPVSGYLERKPRKETKMFAVNWDNGNGACDTFDERFESEQDAQDFADNWCRTMNSLEADYDGYTAEVIELEDEPDTEGEGWDEMGELRQAALDHRGRP